MNFQDRCLSHIPAGVRTQSSDVMLVLLGLPAGVLGLIGQSQSRALDQILPWLAVKGWALCLIVGCVAWLWGIAGVKLYGDVVVLTRLPPYRFGLHLLSVASLVYGVAILLIGGWNGVLAAWPLVAFSSMTYLKAVDLGRIQRRAQDPS